MRTPIPVISGFDGRRLAQDGSDISESGGGGEVSEREIELYERKLNTLSVLYILPFPNHSPALVEQAIHLLIYFNVHEYPCILPVKLLKR